MRRCLALCLLTLLTACSPPATPEPEPVADAPAPPPLPASPVAPLPADASAVLGRAESCMHFSGEFNGDGSENDREVTAAMNELGCDRLDGETKAIKHKYRHDAAVQQAFKALEEGEGG
ncbi:hypothetical protein [Chitiniphilus eburneus]|uniref:Uncharacterized protein n=1 Tax=Chitiniphilus eburneus TaxID=2571148 RepID=A0A4V6WI03_9NEIS|nr:hypothetical protein [Chitiniphilus eburneus]TJZ65368.1 hypothetical protein FAZ21_18255 [Chitiniphilus eburneus]